MGDRVQCSLIGREGAGIRNSRAHVNGIENFWGIAKTWLVKFRGIRKDTFCLHLKEPEFRFNHRQENLYALLLQKLITNPL